MYGLRVCINNFSEIIANLHEVCRVRKVQQLKKYDVRSWAMFRDRANWLGVKRDVELYRITIPYGD